MLIKCSNIIATKSDVTGNKVLEQQRADQLSQRQQAYKWQKFPDSGLPSAIDDHTDKLPADEQFGIVKNFDFTTGALDSVASLKVAGMFVDADDLHAYEVLADKLGGEQPLYQAGRWTTDVEFGRQMMNGVNPIFIKKCEKLPPNFPVTNEMVQPFIDGTLQQEMEVCMTASIVNESDAMVTFPQAGHIYICDMKIMDGLESRAGYYNVAPICLLYVNKAKQLVPIAIQLKQNERNDNPIFLPSDNWIDWLLAKTYYQTAHSQVLYSHLN